MMTVLDEAFRARMLVKGIHVFHVSTSQTKLIGVAVLWDLAQHNANKGFDTFGLPTMIPVGLAHEASVIVVAEPNRGWKIVKSRYGHRDVWVPTWEKVLEQFDPNSAIQ